MKRLRKKALVQTLNATDEWLTDCVPNRRVILRFRAAPRAARQPV